MWLSLNQGAEYLVQKYGARIARRVAESPPPTTINVNGWKGYDSSKLDVWAKKSNRMAAGRGASTADVIEVNGKQQDQGILGQALEWMSDRPRGRLPADPDAAFAAVAEIGGPRRPGRRA